MSESNGDAGAPGRVLPTFLNPLLPKPSQDPYVILHEGSYYAVNTNGRVLSVRRSADLFTLYREPATVVWQVPARGPCSRHVWAPELHFLNSRWFIYFAADDGRNRNHRTWVLEAQDADPTGPYRLRGTLQTGGWAIDATVCHDERGQLFVFWSGWAGPRPGPQNLYVAPLADPLTVSGPRVLLAEPAEPWERRGAPVCEGPAILRRNGVTCLVYSASASWTADHCLGLLVNCGGDYANPAAWQKKGPVFERTAQVWGIGHCSFVTNHDGVDVIFYHAKTRLRNGWRVRNIRAQTFFWKEDGLPCFGSPVPCTGR
ncbi:MAG: glycoside hydrolase family 43 protein, partial [Verrucomicrobia bacterium]|nr:glycoside hydrolase family 43 protein [Verrucomicrobiota bacterium]